MNPTSAPDWINVTLWLDTQGRLLNQPPGSTDQAHPSPDSQIPSSPWHSHRMPLFPDTHSQSDALGPVLWVTCVRSQRREWRITRQNQHPLQHHSQLSGSSCWQGPQTGHDGGDATPVLFRRLVKRATHHLSNWLLEQNLVQDQLSATTVWLHVWKVEDLVALVSRDTIWQITPVLGALHQVEAVRIDTPSTPCGFRSRHHAKHRSTERNTGTRSDETVPEARTVTARDRKSSCVHPKTNGGDDQWIHGPHKAETVVDEPGPLHGFHPSALPSLTPHSSHP